MRTALTAITAALTVACGGDGVTGSSSVAGPYTLRSINGSPLPYTVAESASGKTEIVGDVITLYVGGTYAESVHSRTTTNGQVTNESRTEGGSYVIGGTSITLQRSGGGPARIATMSGNTMSIVEAGMTAVYTK